MDEKRIEQSAQRARQGRRGRPVLAILLSSLVLLAIVFIGLSLFQTAGVVPSIGGIENATSGS